MDKYAKYSNKAVTYASNGRGAMRDYRGEPNQVSDNNGCMSMIILIALSAGGLIFSVIHHFI